MYIQNNNPFLKKGDVKRTIGRGKNFNKANDTGTGAAAGGGMTQKGCLLYTSPSPRDRQKSRMPSSA